MTTRYGRWCLGAAVALFRFPGRGAIVVILNALMGLPPVVVGLVVYLVLSRAGPLGVLGLLFTLAVAAAGAFLGNHGFSMQSA